MKRRLFHQLLIIRKFSEEISEFHYYPHTNYDGSLCFHRCMSIQGGGGYPSLWSQVPSRGRRNMEGKGWRGGVGVPESLVPGPLLGGGRTPSENRVPTPFPLAEPGLRYTPPPQLDQDRGYPSLILLLPSLPPPPPTGRACDGQGTAQAVRLLLFHTEGLSCSPTFLSSLGVFCSRIQSFFKIYLNTLLYFTSLLSLQDN